MAASNASPERPPNRDHGPDDKLEGLEIALTCFDSGDQQALDLLDVGIGAAGQQQRLAKHDEAFVAPQIEMADPQLLVDRRQQPHDLELAGVRHFQVESTGKMNGLAILHPREGDVVVGPTAGDRDGDFVVAGPLKAPVVERSDLFDHVNRMRLALLVEVDKAHGVVLPPNGWRE